MDFRGVVRNLHACLAYEPGRASRAQEGQGVQAIVGSRGPDLEGMVLCSVDGAERRWIPEVVLGAAIWYADGRWLACTPSRDRDYEVIE